MMPGKGECLAVEKGRKQCARRDQMEGTRAAHQRWPTSQGMNALHFPRPGTWRGALSACLPTHWASAMLWDCKRGATGTFSSHFDASHSYLRSLTHRRDLPVSQQATAQLRCVRRLGRLSRQDVSVAG